MSPILASAGFSLATILTLLFGAAWLVQRLRQQRFLKNPAGANPIQIIATRTIGPQSALLIIEANQHRFLVSTHRGVLTPIGGLGRDDASK